MAQSTAYRLRAVRRTNWVDESQSHRAYDCEELADRLHAAPPTAEERAAAAAGLDAAFPSRAERRAFPERLSHRRGAKEYLVVRCALGRLQSGPRCLLSGPSLCAMGPRLMRANSNKLLLAWEADVTKPLTSARAGASN